MLAEKPKAILIEKPVCGPVQGKESFEIQVTPVDHQNRFSWQADYVEQTYIMHLAGGNADEYGDGAAQIHDHMCFDSSLGLPEVCLGKQRQTQVDDGQVNEIPKE